MKPNTKVVLPKIPRTYNLAKRPSHVRQVPRGREHPPIATAVAKPISWLARRLRRLLATMDFSDKCSKVLVVNKKDQYYSSC